MEKIKLKKVYFTLAVVMTSLLSLASDNVITNNSGQAYFKDNTGNLMPLSISYQTDGAGHLKLINSANPVDDNISVPANTGKMYLNAANGKLYPALVLYSTDGNGNLIPIPSGGGGSVTSVTASSPLASSGGSTPNITIQTASGSQAGALSAADWTTFNGKQAAGSYVLTSRNINTTSPITGGGDLSADRTIAMPAATSSVNGYLTSTDWSTFNGKQAAGSYITALTSDVSASGPGSVAATVNSVGTSSAANIHSAELAANAATSVNTVSTIVKRDSSGNFNAGTITATGFVHSGSLDSTARTLKGSNGNVSVDWENKALIATGGVASIDWTNRMLDNSSGTMLSWGSAGFLSVNSNLISNVLDPVSAQDAATKNYVDTAALGFQYSTSRWVDVHNGSDVTGVGSFLKPWKTISFAETQITTATLIAPWTLYVLGSGQYFDAGLVNLKPNINIIGEGGSALTIDDPITINAVAAADGAVEFKNMTIAGPLIYNGAAANTATLTLTNCLVQDLTYVADTNNFGFLNANCAGNGGLTNADITGFANIFACPFYGTLTIEDRNQPTIIAGSDLTGLAITLKGQATLKMSGNTQATSLAAATVGGNNPKLISDSGSFPLSITGTLNTTTYSSTANNEGYTPAVSGNWATVPTTIAGALDSLAISQLKSALINGASASTNASLIVKDGHWKSTQTTAPTATVQANAGTGSSCSVSNATDTAGKVSITTGTVGISTGSYCNVNFNQAYGIAPICIVSGADGGSSPLDPYPSSSTSALTINFAIAGGISTTYTINYYCIETQ